MWFFAFAFLSVSVSYLSQCICILSFTLYPFLQLQLQSILLVHCTALPLHCHCHCRRSRSRHLGRCMRSIPFHSVIPPPPLPSRPGQASSGTSSKAKKQKAKKLDMKLAILSFIVHTYKYTHTQAHMHTSSYPLICHIPSSSSPSSELRAPSKRKNDQNFAPPSLHPSVPPSLSASFHVLTARRPPSSANVQVRKMASVRFAGMFRVFGVYWIGVGGGRRREGPFHFISYHFHFISIFIPFHLAPTTNHPAYRLVSYCTVSYSIVLYRIISYRIVSYIVLYR